MNSKLLQAGASLAFFFLIAGFAAAEQHVLHTGVPEITGRLQRIARLPATNQLHLAIGLPLRNQGALTNLLHQLYSRSSTNFHRYLTPEQFAERFGPTEQDYQALIHFAQSNRLEVATFGNRAVLNVSGTVSDIEKAFNVTLGTYRHPVEDREFYGPDVEPSVDASLPVLYVSGLDNYVIPRPNSLKVIPISAGPKPNIDNGSGTNGYYIGSDFRNAYVPNVTLDGTGQVVGLVEFGGYTPGDIKKYETLAGYSAVPLKTLLLNSVTNTPTGSANEVSLDIEMVISMAPAQTQVNIYEGLLDTSILNEMVSPTMGEPLPNQISCSFGIGGDTNLEQQLIQMAAQGQSFFYASGDGGAPTAGTNASPQDDNYMTSVGGTELSMNGTGASWQSETVWNHQFANGASYGAVVTSLPIPDYQKGVDMSSNGGSTTHRNIPDVAMAADYILIVYTQVFTNGDPPITGKVIGVGGTSAAAPLWAGFTALVNQQAAAQGRPPVGFLNPAIYDIAQGPLYTACFHDVTVGNDTNTDSENLYFATPGYDLCTGWGSPTGSKLIDTLTGLTGPVFVDFNYTGSITNGNYDTPFKTLAGGTNAVSVGGTIFIKTAGSSSETMTINKAMTITVSDGAATVGH